MNDLTRRMAVLAILVLAAVSVIAAPSDSVAAGPQEVVVIHAVNGAGTVDVYVDGTLHAASLGFGSVSTPFTIADQRDHDIAIYPRIANPPADQASRVDQPVEPWYVTSQPRPGGFFHPDGLTALRLANTSKDEKWVILDHGMPANDLGCSRSSATSTFKGAADLFTTDGGGRGGSGVYSVGGGTVALSTAYSRLVVVQADRWPGPPSAPVRYSFGSFDFGQVTFETDIERMYMAVGNRGNYGAVELVIDCTAQTFRSVRSGVRNPVYEPSRFVALDPVRLFDTRTPQQPSGSLAPQSTLDVQVTGEVGIPETGVSAVVLNVTATNSTGPGYITVWPKGAPRPATSNLNLVGAGQTVPNLVTVPIGAGGEVSFYSRDGADLLADVSGYFVEADEAKAGRFVPLDPVRLFDTRASQAPSGAVGPKRSLSVPIAGVGGVPPSGAAAAVLNVTGIGMAGPGYITVFPGGTQRPVASNVNLAGVGDVAPNLVIVPIGADGSVEFYSHDRSHILADLFGYITDDSRPVSSSGLFVPTTPTRVMDTRPVIYDRFADDFVEPDTERVVPITETGDVPGVGAAAVLANVTGTEAEAPGYVTIWPEGLDRPTVSNLNLNGPGATRANAVLVPLGGRGDLSLYGKSGTHAILDVFGYFTE